MWLKTKNRVTANNYRGGLKTKMVTIGPDLNKADLMHIQSFVMFLLFQCFINYNFYKRVINLFESCKPQKPSKWVLSLRLKHGKTISVTKLSEYVNKLELKLNSRHVFLKRFKHLYRSVKGFLQVDPHSECVHWFHWTIWI